MAGLTHKPLRSCCHHPHFTEEKTEAELKLAQFTEHVRVDRDRNCSQPLADSEVKPPLSAWAWVLGETEGEGTEDVGGDGEPTCQPCSGLSLPMCKVLPGMHHPAVVSLL